MAGSDCLLPIQMQPTCRRCLSTRCPLYAEPAHPRGSGAQPIPPTRTVLLDTTWSQTSTWGPVPQPLCLPGALGLPAACSLPFSLLEPPTETLLFMPSCLAVQASGRGHFVDLFSRGCTERSIRLLASEPAAALRKSVRPSPRDCGDLRERTFSWFYIFVGFLPCRNLPPPEFHCCQKMRGAPKREGGGVSGRAILGQAPCHTELLKSELSQSYLLCQLLPISMEHPV